MGGMEFNKIMGAIVMALLIAMLAGFTAEHVVVPRHLEENAYKVEGVGAAAPAGQAPAAPQVNDISGLMASADPVKGQAVAKACAACHDFTNGGPNKVGPNLWGIFGNHHAHLGDGFAYSAAMKAASGEIWDLDHLNHFLFNPRTGLPGTKMGFAGLKNDQDRANVIAYLQTLK